MLTAGREWGFSRLPEREPESDSDLDKKEEEDRRNEEDDEEEELDRQERQDDEDDEGDDDIYSDDMTASPWTCPRASASWWGVGDTGNTRVGRATFRPSDSRNT